MIEVKGKGGEREGGGVVIRWKTLDRCMSVGTSHSLDAISSCSLAIDYKRPTRE